MVLLIAGPTVQLHHFQLSKLARAVVVGELRKGGIGHQVFAKEAPMRGWQVRVTMIALVQGW
jgi:hypothetical protein